MNISDYIANKFDIPKPGKNRISNFGRNELALMLKDLGFKEGVEIGTERAKYAQVLLKTIPDLKLICVDPYQYYAEGQGYKDNVNQETHNKNFSIARKRLSNYEDRATLWMMNSMEALQNVQDNSLDFVYIDGNHRLDYVVQDLIGWSDKVKPGGIVAGHDYIKLKGQHYSHVPYALGAYVSAYSIPYYFILDNKNKNRTLEENRYLDRVRSWFFIKP